MIGVCLKKMRLALFIGSVAMTAACGYHLRGSTRVNANFTSIGILPVQPVDALYGVLQRTLQAYGITVVEPSPGTVHKSLTLTINHYNFSEHSLAMGNNNQSSRSRLSLQIEYVLDNLEKTHKNNATKENINTPREVNISREYSLNTNAMLQTNYEKETLQQEMLQEAASQIILQISRLHEN